MAVATVHVYVAGIALGARPVYGYDPRRRACGKTPLVLDSVPAKLSLANYVGLAARFRIASRSRRRRVSLAPRQVRARPGFRHRCRGAAEGEACTAGEVIHCATRSRAVKAKVQKDVEARERRVPLP